MNTEDSIVSYVSSENVAPIDLREFYLKGKCEEFLKIDVNVEKICRICMQIGISGFATVNDIKADLIEKYIPEVVSIVIFYTFYLLHKHFTLVEL